MIRLSQKRAEVNYIMKSLISTHLHSTVGTTCMSDMKQCTKNWYNLLEKKQWYGKIKPII